MSLPVRKRHRISKACELCRRRKVKCNLEQPCSTCSKYSNPKCIYESRDRPRGDEESESTMDMTVLRELAFLKEKIQSLESVVVDEGAKSVQPAAEPAKRGPSTIGSVKRGPAIETMMSPSHPYRYGEDIIDFYAGDMTKFLNEMVKKPPVGPLSWIRLMKADTVMRYFVEYLFSVKKKMGIYQTDPQSKELKKRSNSSSKMDDEQEYNFTRLEDQVVDGEKEQYGGSAVKGQIGEKAKKLGIKFYHGELDNELELIQKIELILPTKKVIWLLFDVFFTQLYPFFPFLDEVAFESQIERLLGKRSSEDVKVNAIKIENRSEFAYLGLLLIVLRMANLTLYHAVNEENVTSSSDKEDSFLLNNPINLDAIDLSKLCLEQFDLLKNISLPILQFVLFSRIYQVIAPEIGDAVESYEAQASTCRLVMMANSMGLNKDPEDIHGKGDIKKNNLLRKIWYAIVRLDLDSVLTLGTTAPSINVEFYDTRPPYYEYGNENCRDVSLERMALSVFETKAKLTYPLYDLAGSILRLNSKTRMSELCQKLDTLEVVLSRFHNHRESYSDFFNMPVHETFLQISGFKDFCFGKLAMAVVYYYIFNYYEERGDHSMMVTYIEKLFEAIGLEVLPFYTALIMRKDYTFKRSYDMILSPGYLNACHICLKYIVSMEFRIKLIIANLKEDETEDFEDTKSAYDSLRISISNLHNICLELISKLSNRYYYAWRVTHFHGFLFGSMKEKDMIRIHEPLKLYSGLAPAYSKRLRDLFYMIISNISKASPLYSSDRMNMTTPSLTSDSSSLRSNESTLGPLPNYGADIGNQKTTAANWRNVEVDELWLQMMKIKHMNKDSLTEINNASTPNQVPKNGFANVVSEMESQAMGGDSPGILSQPYDFNVGEDLFDTVIFDHILNTYT